MAKWSAEARTFLTTVAATLVAGTALRPRAAGYDDQRVLQQYLGQDIKLTDGPFWKAWFGGNSFLGKTISKEGTLQLATAWACVRLISETLSTLPLVFYKRVGDKREPAYNHNLYTILGTSPNGDMTAVVFWEAVAASLLLWGNAYIEVLRNGAGEIIGLEFLLPSNLLTAKRSRQAGMQYEFRDYDGSIRKFNEGNLMHIRGFTLDGLLGLDPVRYGVNVLGIAKETDQTSAEIFQDALRASGLVTMDKTLTPPQRQDIREHVDLVSAEGGTMVLEKGAGFQKLGFDPETAELLKSRDYNAQEICRWYRVDPAMVGFGNKDSNWGTGLEQKMLWFITFTLRQWCVRIEKQISKSLLTGAEKNIYSAEFNLEGLLRGDSAARALFYQMMVRNGIFTRDLCRIKENQPPMGGNAAVLTVEANLIPLDKLGQQAQPQTGIPGVPNDPQTRAMIRSWLGIDQLEREHHETQSH